MNLKVEANPSPVKEPEGWGDLADGQPAPSEYGNWQLRVRTSAAALYMNWPPVSRLGPAYVGPDVPDADCLSFGVDCDTEVLVRCLSRAMKNAGVPCPPEGELRAAVELLVSTWELMR